MPKAQWEKAGDEAREKLKQANTEFDKLADEGLEKAESSKYTGWILTGIVIVAILVIVLVAELK